MYTIWKRYRKNVIDDWGEWEETKYERLPRRSALYIVELLRDTEQMTQHLIPWAGQAQYETRQTDDKTG